MIALDRRGNLDCAADHGAGQHRYPQAQGIYTFALNVCPVIRIDGGVDHHYIKIRLAQRRGEGEQAKRGAERWPIVGWVEENDLPRVWRLASPESASAPWPPPPGSVAPVGPSTFFF